MKTLLIIILSFITLSCSKTEQETESIKVTTFLSVGIKNVGEPNYMVLTINGKSIESKVSFIPTAWQSTFNLPVEKFNIDSVELYSKEGLMLYRGVGYYDLEVRHYLTKENPLRVNETAFNEIGLSVSVFPFGW